MSSYDGRGTVGCTGTVDDDQYCATCDMEVLADEGQPCDPNERWEQECEAAELDHRRWMDGGES